MDLLGRWSWVCFWSISLYFTLPGCEADVQPCYIQGSLSLPLGSMVAAYDERASHISGCSVTYKSSTSVTAYVLSLTSAGLAKPNSEKQVVVLNIDQTPLTSLQSSTQIVFVLSSADPVSWDIRTTTLLTLPRILVSRPSTVNSIPNIDLTVVDDLPVNRDDLLEWVGKKHPVATFAEVSYANHISVLLLNQETHVNSTCTISDDWKQTEISGKFVKETLIRGCVLPENSQELPKEVYIIEHNQAEEGTVTVNLRTVTSDTHAHNVVLVLKSSSPSVSWDLHGTLITGNLEIQSNGDVKYEDQIFDSVTRSLTSLDKSGEDLVKYLENQYGGVVQYLFVDTATRIEITLEAPDVPRPPNFLIQDSSLVLKGNDLLEHIIHTQCYQQSMIVAISLKALKKNDMSWNDIHLRDRDCNATMNDTHMIFSSELGKCGMEFKQSKKESIYVNEVFFNPGSSDKGSGSADEDTGSGQLPDDEDASDQRSSVSEVQCSYPIGGVSNSLDLQEDNPITYQVCSGPKCPQDALQFSVATVYKDLNILATVRSCTVSSLDKTVVDDFIIENGCADGEGVVISRNVNETVRINSLPVINTINVYEVTCEVAICSPVKTQKHSQCPDRKTDMPCTLQAQVESDFGPTYTIQLELQHLHGKEQNQPTHVGSNPEMSEAVTESSTVIVIDGLSTIQVVGIAFAAFLMGIFFVVTLLCIHSHTAIPRGNQEQTSASQPPPYQPTSNGYAGYRQVPNGHTGNGYAGNNGHALNGFGPTINPNGIPMNGMMNSADLAMV